jgi:hypothetical protein
LLLFVEVQLKQEDTVPQLDAVPRHVQTFETHDLREAHVAHAPGFPQDKALFKQAVGVVVGAIVVVEAVLDVEETAVDVVELAVELDTNVPVPVVALEDVAVVRVVEGTVVDVEEKTLVVVTVVVDAHVPFTQASAPQSTQKPGEPQLVGVPSQGGMQTLPRKQMFPALQLTHVVPEPQLCGVPAQG